MGTETEEVVTPNDAAQQQNGAPGQEVAEVARPQDDVTADGDQSQGEEAGEKLTDEQKTIRKMQRRIDRLTAGRGAAAREAELLREQLQQFTQRQQQVQEDEPKAVSAQDIERIAADRARQLHQQQAIASRAQEVLKSGRSLQGFDEAVNTVAEEVPFTDRRGMPTPFIEAVLDTDKPAELLHWLGNNPDEAAALAALTPAQLGRRLAKLEDRIEREAKANTSSAPAPLKPVQSRAAPGNEPSDGDSIEDWMKKERARLKALKRA